MQWVGTRGQQQIDDYFDASGTITTGGTAQLLLPQRKSCSFLLIANLSTGNLFIQIGIRRSTATLTSGAVTSVSLVDSGFGFLVPPSVNFLGGGNQNDLASQGATMPHWPTPKHPATGRAVLSAGAIASIEIDDPGSGYLAAPYVYLLADRTDPTGVGTPSATVGIPILANGGSYYVNGTMCPTSAIAIFGATTSQAFTCKWAP